MKENGNKLFLKLAATIVMPMLLMTVAVIVLCFGTLSDNVEEEIKSKLMGISRFTRSVLSERYEGELIGRDGRFYIGENDLTNVYSLVDSIKNDTDVDITVFAGDTRMLTTVVGQHGDRLTGTRLEDEEIVKDVLSYGEEYYIKDIDLEGTLYYGYYVPYKYNGEISGMIFAGVSSERIAKSKWTVLNRFGVVFIITDLLLILILLIYSRRIVKQLKSIKDYIGSLSKSSLTLDMSEDVLKRNDEIGDLGRYAVEVGDVVNDLISTDPLTSLYNRRAGETEFEKMLSKKLEADECYIAAMLDIDFFKTLNDRFGHDFGDRVLVGVSDIMKANSSSVGFVCRWGGEEFLMGMRCSVDSSKTIFENILNDIRGIDEDENGKPLITATIGAAYYHSAADKYEMINKSDECLYKGKNSGRNQLVTWFDQ